MADSIDAIPLTDNDWSIKYDFFEVLSDLSCHSFVVACVAWLTSLSSLSRRDIDIPPLYLAISHHSHKRIDILLHITALMQSSLHTQSKCANSSVNGFMLGSCASALFLFSRDMHFHISYTTIQTLSAIILW